MPVTSFHTYRPEFKYRKPNVLNIYTLLHELLFLQKRLGRLSRRAVAEGSTP
jgi:hypothetical protein